MISMLGDCVILGLHLYSKEGFSFDKCFLGTKYMFVFLTLYAAFKGCIYELGLFLWTSTFKSKDSLSSKMRQNTF